MTYERLRRIVLKYWDTGKLPKNFNSIDEVYALMTAQRQTP